MVVVVDLGVVLLEGIGSLMRGAQASGRQPVFHLTDPSPDLQAGFIVVASATA